LGEEFRHNSGAIRRENADARPIVIVRLDRTIQYSRALVMESKSCGVLDTPLEPVIGLAGGETRWRSMTAYYGAAQCIAVASRSLSSGGALRRPVGSQ
jgi:hypothetical protein